MWEKPRQPTDCRIHYEREDTEKWGSIPRIYPYGIAFCTENAADKCCCRAFSFSSSYMNDLYAGNEISTDGENFIVIVSSFMRSYRIVNKGVAEA